MLTTLRSIVQDVNAASTFEEALTVIVGDVVAAMNVEVCSIYLLDIRSNNLLLMANQGLNKEAVGNLWVEFDEGLVGLVGKRAEPLNLHDAPSHRKFRLYEYLGEEAFNAFLGVPIIHHKKVLGVLVAQQREQRRFDESEEAFLVTLSAQLATVVAHAMATGDIAQLTDASYETVDAKFSGVPGAPGIAIGTAILMQPTANLDAVPDRRIEDVTVELLVFDRAIEAAREEIQRNSAILAESLPPEELALFDAYLHMLDDAAIADDVRSRIRNGQWAQGALRQVILEHVRRFEQMEDSYLRERGDDLKELGSRVLARMQDLRKRKTNFPNDTILVGEEITPNMLAEIPAHKLKGVVSMRGSSNSHVAILSRALDVPTIMGATDLPLFNIDNQSIIVDGFYGEVISNPSVTLLDHYQELIDEERDFSEELEELRELPSVTQDGHRVRLWVNIGLSGDISRSLDRGAEGIGLFRTEVPFMTADRFPTEEEQRIIYREHMEAFEPRPVTMRTLDIGGDKALTYFPIQEDNPFLGWRGIRVTLDHPEIFIVQARAMLKANAGLKGLLRIMLPMISSLGEITEAIKYINQAYEEVVEEGVDVKRPEIGVMIEVPAAVYQAKQIANAVDFLAVGSNDLTQYMLAVDRNNPRVAELYQEVHPAVIMALREVSKVAHKEGKPIGICGELAGTPVGAVLLMAMGYDVLSMNATNLPKVKWIIRNIKLSDARRMLARVLKMGTAAEIQNFMYQQLTDAGLGRVLPSHQEFNG